MATKLEELEATRDAAGIACEAAWDDARDASTYAAVDDYEAAWDARNAAWFDYKAELKITQEEKQND
jgi:hypothetical protein